MNLAFLKAWWKQLVALAVVVLPLVAAFHYYNKAADEQHRADTAEHNLRLANDTITDMQTRQLEVAALDAKYTGELADAKASIDELERDVASGKRWLQVNARCTTNGAPGTTSMDDASSARLTETARRNYFILRQRIETASKQLTGLQSYVREQCLK